MSASGLIDESALVTAEILVVERAIPDDFAIQSILVNDILDSFPSTDVNMIGDTLVRGRRTFLTPSWSILCDPIPW